MESPFAGGELLLGRFSWNGSRFTREAKEKPGDQELQEISVYAILLPEY